YQYLSRYQRRENLDSYVFNPAGGSAGTAEQCLECLMQFCERSDPSWTELSNFAHFLNFQLRKSEQSVFCSTVVTRELRGF
ncbi:RN213 ligase, partial [Upupa epops]|nr:RN213 ligase [Upupa epops]